jgi:hypothetical protein
MYKVNQYNNRPVPYRAPFSNYLTYLNGGNPEPQYPYDALFDQQYQAASKKPYTKYSGSNDYPYYAQRHRAPHTYYDPKPTKYHHTDGYEYKIPKYPPYMYWYPNPVECRDTCGKQVCDSYHNALNNYTNCRRCQRNDPPQCWDESKQMCSECLPEQALSSCQSRSRYGCPNPRGFPNADVPPINPKYTGCKMCRK